MDTVVPKCCLSGSHWCSDVVAGVGEADDEKDRGQERN